MMGHDGGPRGARNEECKEDYAAYVKAIMPTPGRCGARKPMIMIVIMCIFPLYFRGATAFSC